MYGLESIFLGWQTVHRHSSHIPHVHHQGAAMPVNQMLQCCCVSHGEPATPSCSATHCDPDTFVQYCHQQNNSLETLLKRQCALRVRKSWAMNAQDTLDIWHGLNRWHIRIWQPPPHHDTLQTSDTEGVEQTTEGAVRRQIISALASPTPRRTTPYYLACHELPVAHPQSHNQGHDDDGVLHLTGWCKTVQSKRTQRHMSPLRYRWSREHRPLPMQVFLPDSRERFLPRLIRLLPTALGFERLDEHSKYTEIVQLVLDCTAFDPDESHTRHSMA